MNVDWLINWYCVIPPEIRSWIRVDEGRQSATHTPTESKQSDLYTNKSLVQNFLCWNFAWISIRKVYFPSYMKKKTMLNFDLFAYFQWTMTDAAGFVTKYWGCRCCSSSRLRCPSSLLKDEVYSVKITQKTSWNASKRYTFSNVTFVIARCIKYKILGWYYKAILFF